MTSFLVTWFSNLHILWNLPSFSFVDCLGQVLQRDYKNTYDITSQYLAFKIPHYVEFNRKYQPGKFHWPSLSGSNFMSAGEKHPPPPPPPPPPPDLQALKKPSPYRVKALSYESNLYYLCSSS